MRPPETADEAQCLQTPSKAPSWLLTPQLLVTQKCGRPLWGRGGGGDLPRPEGLQRHQHPTKAEVKVARLVSVFHLLTLSSGDLSSPAHEDGGALTSAGCPGGERQRVTGLDLGLTG